MFEQPMKKGLLVRGSSPHMVGCRHSEYSSYGQRRHGRLGQAAAGRALKPIVTGEHIDVRLWRPRSIREHHWEADSPENSSLSQRVLQSEVDDRATPRKLATARENARILDSRLAYLEVQHVDRALCDPAEAP